MNLNLHLTKELGDRLVVEAQRRGLSVAQLAADLIEDALHLPDKTSAAIELLQEWCQQDEQLTDEEFARHRAALRAFDADRLSDRMLFESLSDQSPISKADARRHEQILIDRERILGLTPDPQPIPEGKTLFDVVEGTWPGDETDDEIREALEKLS
jgi:hypothetical protein